MTTVEIARALGLAAVPEQISLYAVDDAALRARAPGVVRVMITYNRTTMAPEPGGLFDDEVFGSGLRERSTRFGRIILGTTIGHPMASGIEISELPVLPPELRPISHVGGELVMSSLNSNYQEVLRRSGRLHKLREIAAPPPLLAAETGELTTAVTALHRVLRDLLQPDPAGAVAALDRAMTEGWELQAPLPRSLHRTVAALFALGIEARSRASA